MPVETEWSEAEDAFLALSCEFVRDERSVRFESAQPAARLNAVRILDLVGLDEAGWARTLGEHAAAFAARELPLKVQLDTTSVGPPTVEALMAPPEALVSLPENRQSTTVVGWPKLIR